MLGEIKSGEIIISNTTYLPVEKIFHSKKYLLYSNFHKFCIQTRYM